MKTYYSFSMVTIKKLAELSGYTEGALRKKIHDGVFVESVHFQKSPDGRIHFDLGSSSLTGDISIH